MTKINSLLSPADALSPQHLAALSEEKRAEELAKGPSYVYYDCFVYEPHALFGTYVIKKGQSSWKVGHRLVDFKSIFRVECEQIERNREVPTGIKVLQLTNTARAQLRNKLTAYFGRDADG